MATRITLIRHGRTAWNANGRWQGHACVPLDDEGQRQAALLAQHLVKTGEQVTALYCSDLARARQTAQIIGQRLGVAIQADLRLREIDMGEWQGLTRAEIMAWDAERFQVVMQDPQNNRRPSGECGFDVARRLHMAVTEYATTYPNGHVLVVSHGSAIYNLLHYLSLVDDYHGPLGNTAISRLIHDSSSPVTPWSLSAFNVVDHLDGGQREAIANAPSDT
ncbi:MAG TPA: histidine phosphatase family protein [Aggregatilineales bacterium]|nr:histidine phosphatase family protein [Aggregatilineales bacterium]